MMFRFRDISICLILIITAMLCCPGCFRTSPDIHYVLPNNYCGAFIVYTERPHGLTIEEHSGRYTYVIPKTGILEVRGKGPFYNWHTTSASFANGTAIPNGEEGLPEDVVAFWNGGSRSGMIYDFVGTKHDFEKFKRETATAEVKPGGCKE